MQAKQNQFLEGPIIKSLLKLAVPIVAANILQAGYQLMDAFWVGRLGGNAVAAVSVSTPVTFLAIALGAGLALAGSTLIAQYEGAQNQSMVNHIAAQTLLMVISVSIVLSGLGYLFSPDFLRLLHVSSEVYTGALKFLRMTFIGLVFNFCFFVFQAIMRAIGQVSIPVYIVFGNLVLNFALDPLFIFGWGPVPAFGVMGAAIATFSTQSLASIIGLTILFRGKHGVQLQMRDFRPNWSLLKRTFYIGFPASIEQSLRALSLIMMTFLISGFGTTIVASFGVGANVLQVVMIPAMGLSMAISALAGQNIGAGNIDRADSIGKLGALLGFSTLAIIGVAAYFFAPHLTAFFVPKDPAVIAGGARFLHTMSLAWGFLGLQLCLTGVLRASGNTVLTMVLTIISQWVLQFPLAYILSHHASLGIEGIWLAFPVSNITIALITIAVYARGDWKKESLTTKDDDFTKEMSRKAV